MQVNQPLTKADHEDSVDEIINDYQALNRGDNFEKDEFYDIITTHIEFKNTLLKNLDSLNALAAKLETGNISPNSVEDGVKETIRRLNDALNNPAKNPHPKTPEASEKFVPPSKEDISEFWMDQPKSSKETVPEFIARIYKPWLGRGLNRAHLKVDPSLSRALTDWLQVNKELPEWLILPNANKKRAGSTYTEEEHDTYKKVAAIISHQKYQEKKAAQNK